MRSASAHLAVAIWVDVRLFLWRATVTTISCCTLCWHLLQCRSLPTKKYPHPITFGNCLSRACLRPTLTPNHFLRRAMHHGCIAGANAGGEGSGGVVADIAKLSVGREAYYTRELATDHEAVPVRPRRVPGPLGRRRRQQPGLQGEDRRPGSRPCSRAATPQPGSCWAAPMAATPCRPLMWSCGRPRASRSSTAWVTR